MTDILPNPDLLKVDTTMPEHELREQALFTAMKITPADTELWLKMGQLRAEVYLDKEYISVEDINEDGAEYDELDERSEHFVAVNDEGEVIGTIRVINRGDQNLPLPSEEEFGVTLPEKSQEISRFMHDLDLSPTEGFMVSLALMRAAHKATNGVSDTIYAVIERKVYRQLNDYMGIKLTSLTEAPQRIAKYRDTENYLVEMQPKFITSQIHERDEAMIEKLEKSRRFADSIISKPFAPFFEKDNATKGLGRISLRDLESPNPEQFERNRGFFSEVEQQRLWDSTVAIAGAGGDGGQLAIALAQLGVRKFKLADPEAFESQNLNRQAGASLATIGQNKAKVIAKHLRGLGATVDVYTDGVTPENIEEFVADSDLIIDETELTMPQLGVMISREARENNVPVLMALNVGFGSYVTSFDPSEGVTFESYLGIDESKTLEEISEEKISIAKWAPHIPTYANTDILQAVNDQKISIPTVVPGVLFAAADASTQAVAHLLADINPEWKKRIIRAPHGRSVDAIDGTNVVKYRSAHFNIQVAIAALRTRFGKNNV